MIGGRYALAAFDQRPHFATAVQNRLKALEQTFSPALWRSISGKFANCFLKSTLLLLHGLTPGVIVRDLQDRLVGDDLGPPFGHRQIDENPGPSGSSLFGCGLED